MKTLKPVQNQQGMALVLTILILAASAAVAISLGVQNVVETRLAANQKALEIAFRHAEAGIEHARVKLASLFESHPQNLARIRAGEIPTWDFLFHSDELCDPESDPDCSPDWDERLVDLGSTSYRVYARDPEDLTQDGSVMDTDQSIIIRSIGYGPGEAKQIVEVRIQANVAGAQLGYYAQEGGGPTKANVNLHDKGKVGGGRVDPGTLR